MLKNVAGQRVQFSLFKSAARIENPTLAIGDFKVKIDAGAQNNVTTLPTSDAAGIVTWLPTQAETNGTYIVFAWRDMAGAEWEPTTVEFDTGMPTSVAAIEVDTSTTLDGRIPGALVVGAWIRLWEQSQTMPSRRRR